MSNAARSSLVTLDVDFPAYLSTLDMVFSWNASGGGPLDPLAPVRWYQSPYIGNGLVGILAIATIDETTNATSSLRLNVGRTDAWSCSNRQPIGYISLTPSATKAFATVRMRTLLANATLMVDASFSDGSECVLSVMVNAADPQGPTGTILIAPEGSPGCPQLTMAWTPDTTGVCANASVASGVINGTSWGVPIQWWTQYTPTGTITSALTYIASSSGDSTALASNSSSSPSPSSSSSSSSFSSSSPSSSASSNLLLTIQNSQRNGTASYTASFENAVISLSTSIAATTASLQAANAAWWSIFWTNSSFFSFSSDGKAGVTALEEFTHIAGFRYAMAARFSMSDLMGPWGPANTTECIGPWCQYCWDMNQQVMMYLPTLSPANRGALLAEPALAMYPAFLNGTWTDIYGSNPPGGNDNLLWWFAAVHRYALLHGDQSKLVNVLLPAMRSLLTDSAKSLSNGTDGLLHVVNCKSPEYPMPPSTDCNYDLAILRWSASTALAIAEALVPNDPALGLYQDLVNRLAPYPVDAATNSYEIAAGLPFSVPHRHYSHLLMIYDFGIEADAARMAASLDVWWNITCAAVQANGIPPAPGADVECRGFTQAAMAAMSMMLNRTDAALGNLTSYLKLVGLPNGMYGEEIYAGEAALFAPVSESTYSAATSVYGLFLASSPLPPVPQTGLPIENQPLRLWPGASFANVSIYRLRGQSAFLVSAVRQSGLTPWIAVEADLLADGSGVSAPASFTLFCPDWLGVSVADLHYVASEGVGPIDIQPVAGTPGCFRVAGLVRGQGVVLYTGSLPPNGVFSVPVVDGRNATEFNTWGSTFVYEGELP